MYCVQYSHPNHGHRSETLRQKWQFSKQPPSTCLISSANMSHKLNNPKQQTFDIFVPSVHTSLICMGQYNKICHQWWEKNQNTSANWQRTFQINRMTFADVRNILSGSLKPNKRFNQRQFVTISALLN